MTAEHEFEKKTNGSAGSTEEEEIIELTDEVPAAPVEEDDGIIELVDEVVVGDAAGPPAEADLAARPNEAVDPLGDMDDGGDAASAGIADSDIRIADVIEDDLEDEGNEDDFVDSLGMDLETNAAIDRIPEDAGPDSEPPLSTEPLAEPVSSDEIEAAVERVLLKILPERIDSILRDAIEQTLTREIDKIKEILLEDSTGRI